MSNDQDERGRFATGNRLGKGNPMARAMQRHRTALAEAASAEDIRRVWKALVEKAVGGDVAAARTVLEFACGKPSQAVHLDVKTEAPKPYVFIERSAKHPDSVRERLERNGMPDAPGDAASSP